MFEEFIGTMPVNEMHRFDEGRLLDYLRGHVDGLRGPLSIEQFKGGQSNPTYRLTGGGVRYVMRSKPGPVAKLLPSAHAIDREYRVMKALHGVGIPVPRMLALCDDESVIGRAFFIMECVEGRVLWDQSLPGMTVSQRGAVYDEMNRVMAALHAVDYQSVGLEGFGRPGNYIARQIDRWSKQYRLSATEQVPAMDELIAWLPRNIPGNDETCVVHGDYRLDNLIFHPTEPRILAILDWELSTLGHPLADFSYHCMSWRIPPGAFRGIGGLDLPTLGIPTEAQYIDAYAKRTGRARIEHWDFYLAYNMFRLSAILQGIMKRALDGTAASQQAIDAGKRARPMAEMGWEIARKLGGCA